MDKNITEFFGSLSEDVKEKLRACKSQDEMLKVLDDANITLNPEILKSVSGGESNGGESGTSCSSDNCNNNGHNPFRYC